MKETVKPPGPRFQEIEEVDGGHFSLGGRAVLPICSGTCQVKDGVREELNTQSEFGLSLAPHLATVRGRVLPPAPLEYRQGRDRSGPVTPIDGGWNLRDRGGDFKFIKPGVCECFATIIFDGQAQPAKVQQFVSEFRRFARTRGMDIGDNVDFRDDFGRHGSSDLLEWLSMLKKEIEGKYRRNLGFLLCILPPTNRRSGPLMGLYQTLKRWSHVVSYLPTQCVLSDKALGKLITNPPCATRAPQPQPCLPRPAPLPATPQQHLPNMAGTTRA